MGTMIPIRSLAFALLLAAALPPAYAANRCDLVCQGLIGEGHAFEAKGQYQQALEKYQAAEKTAPEASLPLSSAAGLLLELSGRVEPGQAAKMRDQARALATRAAAMWADDPIAQETCASWTTTARRRCTCRVRKRKSCTSKPKSNSRSATLAWRSRSTRR
jgi:tetratricopeptide (TPR) repeat protein